MGDAETTFRSARPADRDKLVPTLTFSRILRTSPSRRDFLDLRID